MPQTQTWTEAQQLVRELLRALERIDRLADFGTMPDATELIKAYGIAASRLRSAGLVAHAALGAAVAVLGELRTNRARNATDLVDHLQEDLGLWNDRQ